MAREKKCPQCAEMVKAEASVCRFCGYNFPAASESAVPSGKPKSRRVLKIIGIVVVLMVMLEVVTIMVSGPHAGGNAVGNSSDAGVQNEAAAEDPKQKAAHDLQGATALAAGQAIVKSMRNPDSLVIEGAWANEDGKTLCIRYRAQNGFGGMNRETVVYQNDVPHQDGASWNRYCPAAKVDMTQTVKLATRLQ